MTPSGARVIVRLRGESTDRTGELYAVDSVGVTVRGERLVRMRWPRIAAIDVAKLGKGYDVSSDHAEVDAAHRARLAAVSRFPQGLTGALLERVLSRVGQSTLEEMP